jgi:decaprenyl-phosphate phosphoribosyltransferase
MKINSLIATLRPSHYVKNLFIFLPAFFGGAIVETLAAKEIWLTFISFCALSSVVYIINDLSDIPSDRIHPTKKYRPIASGQISLNAALGLILFLVLVVFACTFYMPPSETWILTLYLFLNLAYSFGLKKIAIVDVLIVAFGFVLRIAAGGEASAIVTSKWLFIMSFLLALGLVLGKRYDDLVLLEKKSAGADQLRGSKYNMEFVRNAIVFVMTLSTVCYIQYAVDVEVAKQFKTPYFFVSILPVILGVLRYFALVFIEKKSASPVKIATKDPVMISALLLWGACFVYFLYLN